MRKFYLPLYSGLNERTGKPLRAGFGWIAVAALLLISTSSFATHLAGGELTYRWISGTTYEFTATFYRDCAGVNAPSTLVLEYYSASCPGANRKQATLNPVPGTGQEITFACGAGQTTCNGGLSPGFQEWKYRATVDLKKNCTDWVFSWSTGKRNNAITTLVNPGGADMYIEATLDNVNAPTASSPTFTNVPVTLVCAGQTFAYNQGALDPNGDSLSYSFICPRTNSSTCVTYNSPYSPTNPIASSPGVTIDPLTGDIVMNPTTIQVGVATILVNKYRNGLLIGSVLRDMEILVVNCSNTLPTATGINGTNVFADTICAGSTVCFNVLSNDLDAGQVVTMTWNNAIPGATFITSGSPYPTGTFCWTPSLADARTSPYTFTVTVKDNNCPINGVQSYAFSVWVPPIAVAISSSPIGCNGSLGTATALGSGGVGPYSYLWNPGGQTTATATGLSAGVTYTVVATDNNGCSNSNTINLTSPTSIVASISDSTNVSCNGGSDGTATVSASGGAGGFTHHWNNGQTTNPATGLAAGTYTDTVADINGCTALVSVSISEPILLTASITTQQNASCKGQANGILTVTAAGGTSPYSYAWSPSVGTDSTVTGLPAGSYTATVTDANGCSAVVIATISEPSTLVPLITAISVVGGNNISCYGLSNGDVTVTVTGGTAPYAYLWSPGGATDSTLTGLTAGTICVKVTDDNGCTADTCLTLTQPDSLIVDFPAFSSYFGGVNISCNGATDGYINTSVTGGTPGYHYSWAPNTADSTADVSGLGAGTYTVTVTDTNGCSASNVITLIEPTLLSTAVSSQTNAGCKGDSSGSITITPTGGTGPYSYAWSTSPNDTTATVTGLPAGTYTVQVTDINGCTTTLVDTITEPVTVVPIITAASVIGGLNIACSGDTSGTAWVTVTGGTAPYTYQWSPYSSTTDTVYNIGAGPISVLVIDSNGCRKLATDTITQPEPVSANYTVSSFLGGANISCSGSVDGSITQIAIGGGTPGYTYLWSPSGQTTSNVTGLGAGLYSVMITDTNGCKDSLFFNLTAPDTLKVDLLSPTTNGGYNISCNGALDGSITVDVTGGTGPFTYTWNPPVSTTSTATGIGAGKYVITIADTNGCSVTDSITLTEPPVLTDKLVSKTYVGGKNVSCYGYTDGCITDSVFGGTPPYSYQWSTGNPEDTTQTLCLVGAGSYTVTVTDANGCTVQNTIILTQPDSISPNAVLSQYGPYNIACNGGTGCITLNPTGGTAGYTYYWTPGEDSSRIFCDTAGTYNVLITDTNGCVSKLDFTLTQPDSLLGASVLSNYGGSNISCSSNCDGDITVLVTGGYRPYKYTWSPNVSTDSTANGLCAGSYTITVTDSNGCSTVVTTALTAPPPLTDTLTLSDYSGYPVSCAGSDGTITITVSGGTRPYQYNWSPSVSTDSTATGLSAGTYTITVTDSNNCSVTDTVTLIAPQVFSLTDSVSDFNGSNIGCNGNTDGYIYVFVNGGVAPYTHHWSTGATTSYLDPIGAGTYTDTITDKQGCKTTITRTLKEPQPIAAIDSVTDRNGSGVSCNGSKNGTISVTVSGGTAPFSYDWSPNTADTTAIVTGLGAGTYTYTVTDANGCSATGSATITEPNPLTVTDSVTDRNGNGVNCNGSKDGIITVTASGGTRPYTFQWTSPIPDTDSLVTGLGAGTYSYTVTDANGCTATGSATITEPAPLSVVSDTSAYGNSGIRCGGDSSGWIHLTVSGGTPQYVYIWNPGGATTQNLDSIKAGTYTYTVTDANGCTATGSAKLTDKPPITSNAGQSQDVCGDQTQLTGSAPAGGQTGTWTVQTGNGVFADDNSPNTSVSSLSSGKNVFTWTITDGFCPASDTVTVNAFDRVASDGGNGFSVCPDSVDQRGYLNAQSPQPGTGFWVSLGKASVVDSLDPNTKVKDLVTGGNLFLWVVVNGPCYAADTVQVTLKTDADCFVDLEMPTGYTPNNDGHNDDFDIHGIERYPNNTLTIFNRWGNIVYSADNYINHQWKGQNNSGDLLPDGTYFAILIIKNSDIKLHGYVDIRK